MARHAHPRALRVERGAVLLQGLVERRLRGRAGPFCTQCTAAQPPQKSLGSRGEASGSTTIGSCAESTTWCGFPSRGAATRRSSTALTRPALRWAYDAYEVVIAGDRASAIEALRAEEPAVVTLDLGLPPDPDGVTEGFATLAEILALKSDTKVIVASGHEAA